MTESQDGPSGEATAPDVRHLSLMSLLADQRQRWENGDRVPVEAYLTQHPHLRDNAEAVLDLIGNEFLLRREAGEPPALEPMLQRFPEWADAIRIQFEVERLFDTRTEVTRPSDAPTAAPHSSEGAAAAPHIADFEIQGILGQGGMGVVYKARQISLKRLVALKTILGGQTHPELLSRFRQEAEAVARLQHPNIVRIFAIGEHQGSSYLSLEYVDGGSLDKVLKHQPQPSRIAAQVVEVLARAIHHAHAHRVIHRDLKPSNVLLQLPDGMVRQPGVPAGSVLQRAVPKITDFGLAKHLDSDSEQTQTGAILGTPTYMAPEQASGHSREIGPAVDTYALGVILYEMLTGRPPFAGDSVLDILDKVRHSDPERPTKLQPKLHRDLETICLKALAKKPAQRYESALALAEDLARFNAGEPIKARPEGIVPRWLRRLRRHPVAVLVTLFATIALLAGGVWYWNWSSGNREQQLVRRIDAALEAPALTQEFIERVSADLEELQAMNAELAGAARLRLRKSYGRFLADVIRKTHLPPAEIAHLKERLEKLSVLGPDLVASLRADLKRREAGWDPLFPAGIKEQLALFEPADVVLLDNVLVPNPAAEPAGLILSRQPSGNREEWSAEFDRGWEEGTEVGLVLNAARAFDVPVTTVAFSSDGKTLAAAAGARGAIGAVKLWEMSGKERFTYRPEKPGAISSVYFPDASRVAVACESEPAVHILDSATGKILHQLAVPIPTVSNLKGVTVQGVGSLALSRDGQTLVTGAGVGGKAGEIRVWRTRTWEPGKILSGFTSRVGRLALSANGRYLAAAFEDRRVKVFDLAADKEIFSGRPFHADRVPNLCFTSDSQTLFASFNLKDKPGAMVAPLHKLDLVSGASKDVDMGFHSGGLGALALAPDDVTLAAASQWNGHLNLCRAAGKPLLFQMEALASSFESLAFSPNGNYLAMGTRDGNVRVRQVDNGQLTAAFENQGYAFNLRPTGFTGRRGSSTLKGSRAGKGMFHLAITRNGAVLREQEVPAEQIADGPLHLVARRDGTQLFFQVNQLPPLEFREIQALPARGVFALNWPAKARLKSLQAMQRHLEEQPSLLKEGDELFARERYAEALTLYGKQAVEAREREVLEEAHCKSALCQVKLQRFGEAAAEFERMIAASGLDGNQRSPWPAVAACELLQIYLRQKRTKEVDDLFDALSAHYKSEQLLPLVSKESRDNLIQSYAALAPEVQLVFNPRAADLRNLDRAARAHDYFKTSKAERAPLRGAYLRGYHFHGKLDQARQTAEESLREQQANKGSLVEVVERLCWILRQQGQPQLALTKANEFLAGHDAPAHKTLLVERARIHVALKNWEQAEADLDEVLKMDPLGLSHRHYAGACLARGFLYLRRQEDSAAVAAWKRGLYSARGSTEGVTRSEGDILAQAPALDALSGTMLAALSGDLSTAEADQVLESLMGRRSDEGNSLGLLQQRLAMPPGILRDMWRTASGKEWARRLAFQELSYAETLRLPLILLGAEFVRQSAMPPKVTPEQEEILWSASEKLYLAYMDDKLRTAQMIGLAFTWKGTTNFLGWGGLSSSLEPSLRGPLAYVLGHRYQSRLKAPADALMFFQTAVKDAPPGSALRRLAQAELNRLKKARVQANDIPRADHRRGTGVPPVAGNTGNTGGTPVPRLRLE